MSEENGLLLSKYKLYFILVFKSYWFEYKYLCLKDISH